MSIHVSSTSSTAAVYFGLLPNSWKALLTGSKRRRAQENAPPSREDRKGGEIKVFNLKQVYTDTLFTGNVSGFWFLCKVLAGGARGRQTHPVYGELSTFIWVQLNGWVTAMSGLSREIVKHLYFFTYCPLDVPFPTCGGWQHLPGNEMRRRKREPVILMSRGDKQ